MEVTVIKLKSSLIIYLTIPFILFSCGLGCCTDYQQCTDSLIYFWHWILKGLKITIESYSVTKKKRNNLIFHCHCILKIFVLIFSGKKISRRASPTSGQVVVPAYRTLMKNFDLAVIIGNTWLSPLIPMTTAAVLHSKQNCKHYHTAI